jgi:hypothetical protein
MDFNKTGLKFLTMLGAKNLVMGLAMFHKAGKEHITPSEPSVISHDYNMSTGEETIIRKTTSSNGPPTLIREPIRNNQVRKTLG